MRCCVSGLACLFLVLLLAGCNDSSQADAARQAEEQAAKERAEREQTLREQERLAAEHRRQEELKNDFELLLGHWDYHVPQEPNGKSPPAVHLEITPDQLARFHMVSGVVESSTECQIRLVWKDDQRLIVQGDGSSRLKLSPLGYRLDGDKLTLTGGATDVLLKDVNLSGEWRRTDWTKKSEAEIAHALKNLGAHLVYDETNPAKPIVRVTFDFQAPIHNVHLRILAGLKYLQELDLSAATNISDAGLMNLAALKQLKQLNLSSTTVSDEAMRQLARELPNCQIIR
jgi:hypothetical protein